MSLSLDAAAHIYRDGDKELVSVTKLLGAVGLAKDLSFLNLDEKYRSRGHAVHEILGVIDQGFEPEIHVEEDAGYTAENLLHYCEQISKWKQDTKFQGRVWELPMANTRLGYAGTLDVLGEVPNGDILLVDAKTGTVQICGVGCQLAAYDDLLLRGEIIRTADKNHDEDFIKFAREHPHKIRRRSLNLKESGPYTLRAHDELRWGAAWRAAVVLYQIRREFGLL